MIFPTTRAAAKLAVQRFIPQARLYARDRNFVKPGHEGVSRLSPMLRHRLILEHEVAEAAIAAHGFGRVEKFVQEVYWRRYWKAWLSLRPQVWHEACAFPTPSRETEAGRRALSVMAGDSGNRLIDHFTTELVETGYLHNHARMWFAAWWIHAAGLPWQWGSAFFFSHLLDGDPASNTLSWRWVAGLQTPGKTYLARRANLEKYLDPAIASLVGDALADFENPSPRLPAELPRSEITRPHLQSGPLIAGPRTGLWVHEEDLAPEHSPVATFGFDAVMVAGHADGWRHHAYSDARVAWLEAALADAACRAANHWRLTTVYQVPEDLAAALVSWAAQANLERIVALRPDPGPLDDESPRIERTLADAGIRLAWVDRPEDLALRPLAKRGFFDFWKKLSPGWSGTAQIQFTGIAQAGGGI